MAGGLGAALLICVALLAGPTASAAAATDCANADAHPHDVSLVKIRAAITCLINEKRKAHGRVRLDSNGKLETAAQSHNDVMLDQDCFEHRCQGEPRLRHRIGKTGYLDGAKSFAFAEDLGFETTPAQMIRRWMKSRFNRKNILHARFGDVGVGVGWGSPVASQPDANFATYTVVFAWRRG